MSASRKTLTIIYVVALLAAAAAALLLELTLLQMLIIIPAMILGYVRALLYAKGVQDRAAPSPARSDDDGLEAMALASQGRTPATGIGTLPVPRHAAKAASDDLVADEDELDEPESASEDDLDQFMRGGH